MQTNKETHVLYNGDVIIDFYPDSHRYKMRGRTDYLISNTAATGIVDKSGPLMHWALDLAKKYIMEQLEQGVTITEMVLDEAKEQHKVRKEEAASIGDIVHQFAHDYAIAMIKQTSAPEIPEDAQDEVLNGINAFLNWVTEHKVEFLEAEVLLYSKQYDYVGKTDIVAKVDGVKGIFDYKTAKGIYDEMRFQLSGYKQSYEEERKEKLPLHGLLHFDKITGEFTPYMYGEDDFIEDFKAFLGCLAVKKRIKELGKGKKWY